jgi:chemotaxis methyl-accepting protein methylase
LILKAELYPEFIIPESVSGNELYTLKLILMEAKLDYRVDLCTICSNELLKEQVGQAYLPQARFKNSSDNYQALNPGKDLEKHTSLINGKRYLNKELLENINFRIQAPGEPFCGQKTKLVLYRNRMIYQTAEYQYRMLKTLLEDMKAGTYLITGIMESIDGFGLDHLYDTISPDLKIYRRNHAH